MSETTSMEDYVAISELKARYCRMLDEKNWDGWAALFTEDFLLDSGGSGGGSPIRGRDAAVAKVRAAIETAKTAHQVHTPELIIDGDEARGIWAMQDRVIWGADRPSITGYGHYRERYVRRDGRWQIAELRLTRLLIDMQPPAA